jgi:hypothetical protein
MLLPNVLSSKLWYVLYYDSEPVTCTLVQYIIKKKNRTKHMNAPRRTHNWLIAVLVVHTVTIALHRVKHHIIKRYRRMEIKLHAFLTSALDGNGQLHPLVTLPL